MIPKAPSNTLKSLIGFSDGLTSEVAAPVAGSDDFASMNTTRGGGQSQAKYLFGNCQYYGVRCREMQSLHNPLFAAVSLTLVGADHL
jgi:hypothetical protein